MAVKLLVEALWPPEVASFFVPMHLMYVDESGDDGFPKSGKFSGSTPSRTFIRIGLIIHDRKWTAINNAVKKWRRKHSIPDTVEIHATEIFSGRKRIFDPALGKKRSITNWFGLKLKKKSDRIALLKDACHLIAKLDAGILAVVIDKGKIKRSVVGYKQMPKSNSWEYLIERYNLYLDGQADKKGAIIADAVSQKLEQDHRGFAKAIYSQSMHVDEFHFIESILFEPSDSSNLIQLADIIAYALQRSFNYGDNIYYDIIEPQLFRHNGAVDGYGLKVWPR